MAATGPAPLSLNTDESRRQQHTRLRRRLLYGLWEADLARRIEERVGSTRRAAWGRPDMSANPFRSICQQVAVLYDEAPVLSHAADPQGTLTSLFASELDRAGLWQLMSRVQRDTVGMRECLVRVDIDEDDGRLLVREAYADLIEEGPTPSDCPDELGSVRECRSRALVPGGTEVWTFDVVDPSTSTYQVLTAQGEDVSDVLGAPASGDAYPWRLADGTPILPYALYHGAVTGQLWDPWEAIEVVYGTLDVGVLWSFWHHAVRDASWPQRYAAGYAMAGSSTVGDGPEARTEAVMDPAVLAILVPILESGGTGLVGQWEAGVDIDVLATAILAYERRLAAYFGLDPSDFARVSGDPRSAYALMISRDGQRTAARRLEPQFRRSDVQLLTICAATLNRWSERHGLDYRLPEEGWQLRYQAIPPSSDEMDARRRNALELLAQGLLSRAGAYAQINGVSDDEARRAIVVIDAERRAGTGNRPPPVDDPGAMDPAS